MTQISVTLGSKTLKMAQIGVKPFSFGPFLRYASTDTGKRLKKGRIPLTLNPFTPS